MSEHPSSTCRYCGRVQDHQCRNTRDMEDIGDDCCRVALREVGGGERSVGRQTSIDDAWTKRELAAAEALRRPLQRFFGVTLAPLALRNWARLALAAADAEVASDVR